MTCTRCELLRHFSRRRSITYCFSCTPVNSSSCEPSPATMSIQMPSNANWWVAYFLTVSGPSFYRFADSIYDLKQLYIYFFPDEVLIKTDRLQLLFANVLKNQLGSSDFCSMYRFNAKSSFLLFTSLLCVAKTIGYICKYRNRFSRTPLKLAELSH